MIGLYQYQYLYKKYYRYNVGTICWYLIPKAGQFLVELVQILLLHLCEPDPVVSRACGKPFSLFRTEGLA